MYLTSNPFPIFFDKEISTESLVELTEKLYQARLATLAEENIHLYFSSDGGDADLVEAFVSVIETYRPTLIGYKFLASSAMSIFCLVNTNKLILPNTDGMIHNVKFQEITLDRNLKPTLSTEYQKILKDKCRDMELIFDAFELSKKERETIDKGFDIHVTTEQIVTACKNVAKLREEETYKVNPIIIYTEPICAYLDKIDKAT